MPPHGSPPVSLTSPTSSRGEPLGLFIEIEHAVEEVARQGELSLRALDAVDAAPEPFPVRVCLAIPRQMLARDRTPVVSP